MVSSLGSTCQPNTISCRSRNLVYLDSMISCLHNFALAPSTHSTYSTGLRAYQLFCSQVSLPPLPLQESNFQRFVASLVHRVGFKSIKVYLSGIQYWEQMCGDSAHISSMSRLFYLLRGIGASKAICFVVIAIHQLQYPSYISYTIVCSFFVIPTSNDRCFMLWLH